MLQGADDNFIARLEKMFQAIGQEIQRTGGAVGKDDLPAVTGIQPLRNLEPTVFERLRRVSAGQVLRAVYIGCAIGVVMRQRVEQGLGFLRSGGVVQISLVLPLQSGDGRKIGAPGGGNHHGL